MARTEEISAHIMGQFKKKVFDKTKKYEQDAYEIKKKALEVKQAHRRIRQRNVLKDFKRSLRCWNVRGSGATGKLGGCDGVTLTCKMCYEYNERAFTAAAASEEESYQEFQRWRDEQQIGDVLAQFGW